MTRAFVANRRRPSAGVLLLGGIVLSGLAATEPKAQSTGGNYEITRYSVHAGGERSSGGNYSLTGSPGQAEAATRSAEAADYTLTGGLLARGRLLPSAASIFSDGFE